MLSETGNGIDSRDSLSHLKAVVEHNINQGDVLRQLVFQSLAASLCLSPQPRSPEDRRKLFIKVTGEFFDAMGIDVESRSPRRSHRYLVASQTKP